MSKQKVHFVHNSLITPTNPITVNVIGGGGTGSHLIEVLARINFVLLNTGRAGLSVNLFDPDTIETPNLGRAAFNSNYVGINKAVAVINNINRKFGTNWKGIGDDFVPKQRRIPKNRLANITLSCVDTVKARMGIAQVLKKVSKIRNIEHQRDKPLYLIDFGNERKTGQVLLSTIGQIDQPESELFCPINYLPSLTEEYGDLLSEITDIDDAPSCSLFEALNKQSLFINSILAGHAGALIDEMLNEGVITTRGFFVNLENHNVEPIKL